MKKIRHIYDLVLSLGKKTYGAIALFFISFFESILFPIHPDVPLIPLLIGNRKNYLFALICSLGSILVICFGSLIGQFIWWSEFEEFSQLSLLFFQYVSEFDIETFNHLKSLHERYDFLIIFTAGFTLITFKIFTLSSGAFSISFSMFVITSLFSRSSRFLFC
tara:strand:- start:554 stop:1042 length:489 start_codon:yes stop_codon:yes gene_type:complete